MAEWTTASESHSSRCGGEGYGIKSQPGRNGVLLQDTRGSAKRVNYVKGIISGSTNDRGGALKRKWTLSGGRPVHESGTRRGWPFPNFKETLAGKSALQNVSFF